jgi:hypothetical protein
VCPRLPAESPVSRDSARNHIAAVAHTRPGPRESKCRRSRPERPQQAAQAGDRHSPIRTRPDRSPGIRCGARYPACSVARCHTRHPSGAAEQRAQQHRGPAIRHAAPPFRKEIRKFRRAPRWQRLPQRPRDARAPADAGAMMVTAATDDHFPKGAAHATMAAILDTFALLAVGGRSTTPPLPPRPGR